MTPDEIRALRSRLRLTQKELGKKIGVSSRSVVNWEAGIGSPRSTTLLRLRELAGMEEVRSSEPESAQTSTQEHLKFLEGFALGRGDAFLSKIVQGVRRVLSNDPSNPIVHNTLVMLGLVQESEPVSPASIPPNLELTQTRLRKKSKVTRRASTAAPKRPSMQAPAQRQSTLAPKKPTKKSKG